MTLKELDIVKNEARDAAYKTENLYPPEITKMWQSLDKVINDEKTKKEILYMLIMLIEIMKEDIACFFYKKQDGSIRQAYGTRKSSIIDYYLTISGKPNKTTKEKESAPSTLAYFDLDKLEWRCFRLENLIGIDTQYII